MNTVLIVYVVSNDGGDASDNLKRACNECDLQELVLPEALKRKIFKHFKKNTTLKPLNMKNQTWPTTKAALRQSISSGRFAVVKEFPSGIAILYQQQSVLLLIADGF